MQKKNEMPKQVIHSVTRYARLKGIRFIMQGNFPNGITEIAYRYQFVPEFCLQLEYTVAVWRVKKAYTSLFVRMINRAKNT